MEGMRLLSNIPLPFHTQLESTVWRKFVKERTEDVHHILGRATSSHHSISLVWFSVGMHGDAGAVVVCHVLDDHEL